MNKVIIIEDEEDIASLLALHLRRLNFEPIIAYDGQEGLDLILNNHFVLALVDWMLPTIDGIEIVKAIRKRPKLEFLPILMITAKSQASDIVDGLEAGADDYLPKPIDLTIFKARVKALVRRVQNHPNIEGTKFSWQGILIDGSTFEALVEGKDLKLTKSECKILLALIKHQGKVLTRDVLIDEVQGEGVSVIRRTIDTHMVALRKKLGEKASLIESIRGVGYRVKME